MACSSYFITITLIFFFLNVPCTKSEAQTKPSYIFHICSANTSVYSPKSAYQRNLNTLLSTLASNTTDYVSGFGNSSVGRQGSSNQVNGLFLCRADVSAATCRDCVIYGTKDMVRKCSGTKESIIWYDECMLSYSNDSILFVTREAPTITLYNTMNVSDTAGFASLLDETLSSLLSIAADGHSGKKFAAQKASFGANQTLYTLVQCTPDLSASNCSMCLQDLSMELPTYPEGARVLSPGCNLRYEMYPFYNETAVALLSPPSPAPAPSPEPVLPPPRTPSPTVAPSPSLTVLDPPKNNAARSSVTVQAAAAAAALSVYCSLFFLW